MFPNSNRLKLAGIIGLLLSLSFGTSAQAETCYPLDVIGGDGTAVTKTVSPFSTLVTRNNWNTDFAVPSNRAFTSYEATIVTESSANYDVELNLKYSDNSSSAAYKKFPAEIVFGEPLKVIGSPRAQRDPYQVNVFVGGLNAIGKTYTVSVTGCI